MNLNDKKFQRKMIISNSTHVWTIIKPIDAFQRRRLLSFTPLDDGALHMSQTRTKDAETGFAMIRSLFLGGLHSTASLFFVAAVTVIVASPLARAQQAQSAGQHQFMHNASPSQQLFDCNPRTEGQAACQAGHQCVCRYDAFGSSMRGQPPGYRWDCNIQNGGCLSDIPADTSGRYGNAAQQQMAPFIMPQINPQQNQSGVTPANPVYMAPGLLNPNADDATSSMVPVGQ
ncbi:hypothetical protein CCP2SC5_390013 [Azospirillaceae bacterium]